MKVVIRLFFFCSTILVLGQEYLVVQGSSVTVSGTSTWHDWEMTSTSLIGSGRFKFNGARLDSIDNLNILLEVNSLKSGKSGLDKDAYSALREEDYPEIVFALKAIKEIKQSSKLAVIKGTGLLTIAGHEKMIDFESECRIEKNIICSGELIMKMTDYKVEPPTIFLGILKTKDTVNIAYRIVWERNKHFR